MPAILLSSQSLSIVLSLALWIISIVSLTAIVWRLASRRQSLPCPVWLRWLVELDNPFTKSNRAAFIIGTLDLRAGMQVLDAGCGPGRLTLPLARQLGADGRVVALDIQAGMLNRVRSRAEVEGLTNIDYVHAGLGDDSVAKQRFDYALLVTVLGEIPDQTAALTELCETLKAGGRLVIVEVIFDPHFQSRTSVTRLAAACGLQEKAFFGHRLAYVKHFQKPVKQADS